MNRGWLIFSVLACWALVGCRPGYDNLPTATPQPTPQLVRMAISPAALPAEGAITACGQATPGIALVLQEAPEQDLESTRFDLMLSLGEPGEFNTFLAPIGSEQISIIAQKDIPLNSLSMDDLQALFNGEIRTWGELLGPQASYNTEVILYGYPPGDPLRRRFETAVLGTSPSIPGGVFLTPNPAAMRDAVSETPGALGYLPRAWVDDRVGEIPLPQLLRPAFTLPLLVSSPTTPSSAAENLVRCLQGPIGQHALAQIYLSPE